MLASQQDSHRGLHRSSGQQQKLVMLCKFAEAATLIAGGMSFDEVRCVQADHESQKKKAFPGGTNAEEKRQRCRAKVQGDSSESTLLQDDQELVIPNAP
ncbi:hypothetical protein NDA11_005636 [Ustilago hordei]|nr:hypothetical protein NDA10_000463 [Ustilago hordei]KAJ1587997.1 hypothetical protein NDA12_002791 [Ustilago hordei]KAJ1593175.1 hypothetical protein NDA11_005636 [Ustilago hordei]KAJ1601324.1 hypothetical protein NDA14_001327 [Ustilago hordei]